MSGPTIKSAFNYAAPSPADTDVQEFMSSGTWIKPAGANMVMVELWGAGGGGGSGAVNTTFATGASGGSGGGYTQKLFKASAIDSTVVVTVGAGGAGGVGATGSQGNSGNAGGSTSFGAYAFVSGGLGGGRGEIGTAAGTVAGGGLFVVNGAASSNPVAGTVTTSTGGQFGGSNGSFYSAWAGGMGSTTQAAGGGASYFSGAGGGGSGQFTGASTAAVVAGGGAGGTQKTQGGGAAAGTPASKNGANATENFVGGGGGSPVLVGSSAIGVLSMAYGDGKVLGTLANSFYLVQGTGTGLATWQIIKTSGISGPLSSAVTFSSSSKIYYFNSRWIVINSAVIYTSTNVTDWSPFNTLSGTGITALAFSGGTYAVSSSTASVGIRTSTDLTNWTTRYNPFGMNDVIHDGTRWIAVGAGGRSLTSTDGVTWTLVTTATSGNWFRVASNGAATNATLVALSDASPYAWRSTDSGATWSAVSTTLTAGQSLTNGNIVYADGRFLLTISSVVYTSTDGNTWTTQTDGTTDTYSNPVYDTVNAVYAVGSLTVNSNYAITSPTGTTWTTRSASSNFTEDGGNGGNGGLAAGGGGGALSVTGTSGAGGNGGNGLARITSW